MGNGIVHKTINARRALGVRVGEGGRRGVRTAGGVGSLVAIVNINININNFPIPHLTVAW